MAKIELLSFTIVVTKCSECPWFIRGERYISVAALSGCEWDSTEHRCVGESDPYKYAPVMKDVREIHPDCPKLKLKGR